MKPFANADVATKFDSYPPDVRLRLLALRELIFQTAARTHGAGQIEESLKWGAGLHYKEQERQHGSDRLEEEASRPLRDVLQLPNQLGRNLQNLVSQ